MNKYEQYKKVDLPWLEEIPEHWELTRVKNLFKIHKDISYKNEPTVLSLTRKKVKVRDISNNQGQLAGSYNNYNEVKKGDLLLNPMDLYSGPNCNISYYDGVISPAYINLRAFSKVSVKYYDYIFKLQYISLAFQSVGKGVSLNNRWTISNETLLKYSLPLPPLVEQEQIAAYLDWKINEIDQLILVEKEKTAQIEIYKQKFIDSVINDLVEPSIPLKDILSFGKGLSITKENLGENGTRCISYGEIHGGFRFSFISNDKRLKGLEKSDNVSISNSAVLEQGDFVFADTSEDLIGCGNFSFLEEKNTDIYAGYHTIVGKRKRDFNSKYLAYYFESEKWREQIRKQVKGIKVFSITQSILKATKVQIPNLEKQLDVVTTLDLFTENCENLLGTIQLKISSLEALKKSLISEVVTGKIDVRNIVIPTYEKIGISASTDEEEIEE